MADVPDTMETSRLTLRMFEESDWQQLCDLFRDEESVRYTIKTPLEDWQTWRMLACYVGHWKIRGYATEAAAAVRDMVMRDLKWKRLISLIFHGNRRSVAVAQRLGATFERTIPFRGGAADIFVHDI